MAFFSGLFFTANNFIIKAARLSFGELLAVRSIIQIPLVSLILFMKGRAVLFLFSNSLRDIKGNLVRLLKYFVIINYHRRKFLAYFMVP